MPPRRAAAPAKINLYLHVTGKRPDGYHLLDSLVAFADIGDEVTIEDAPALHLTIDGPFAPMAPAGEENILLKAARRIGGRMRRPPDYHIRLTKTLPVGAGIGGGSADAAALARLLMQTVPAGTDIDDILLSLGADVPACYISEPLRFTKIGEEIERVAPFPALHALLANPGEPCATQAVFKSLALPPPGENRPLPAFTDRDAVYRFLETTRNDLTGAACALLPSIRAVLTALEGAEGARLARMSGSGATCFALFDDGAACRAAGDRVAKNNPHWWVRAVTLRGA